MVTELCPCCEREVELEEKFQQQNCPNCGEKILPCNQCHTRNCKDCPLVEQ